MIDRIAILVRTVLPTGVTAVLVRIYQWVCSGQLFIADQNRFMAHYSAGLDRASEKQLASRLIFYSHSLEKGMSHDKIRYGFGKNALVNLARTLVAYNESSYSKLDLAYVNTLSVLRAYRDLHHADSAVLRKFDQQFIRWIDEIKTCESQIGGAFVMDVGSKKRTKSRNFKELFLQRYSVRSFSDMPVDFSAIEEVVTIASKTPSVCNRQPSKVYFVDDKEKIADIIDAQGGFTGYELPPVLIAVTTDIAGYVEIKERNQPYIDGGAFALAVMLGLEYEGLAACPLNAMFTRKQESRIRSVMRLSDNEVIIMFIAVGHFKGGNNVAKSFRYGTDAILKRLD